MKNLITLIALALMSTAAFAENIALPAPKWSLAIHGGAGTLDPKDMTPEKRAEYEAALQIALDAGAKVLNQGGSAMDAVKAAIIPLEDSPLFNAGKGAVYNEQGQHELDASIMDGSTLQCGAVAGVRTVRHPVSLARLVMEKTRHVLLAGDGAEKFADNHNVERVPNDWFDTEPRRKQLDEALQERAKKGMTAAADAPADRRLDYGTVGCVALDAAGFAVS